MRGVGVGSACRQVVGHTLVLELGEGVEAPVVGDELLQAVELDVAAVLVALHDEVDDVLVVLEARVGWEVEIFDVADVGHAHALDVLPGGWEVVDVDGHGISCGGEHGAFVVDAYLGYGHSAEQVGGGLGGVLLAGGWGVDGLAGVGACEVSFYHHFLQLFGPGGVGSFRGGHGRQRQQ